MDNTLIKTENLYQGAEVYLPDGRLVKVKAVRIFDDQREIYFLGSDGKFGQKLLSKDVELTLYSGDHIFKADYSDKIKTT